MGWVLIIRTYSSPDDINPVEIQVFIFQIYTYGRIKNTPKPLVKATFY